MPCAGAAGEACGGPQRISVYESSISNRPGTNPGVEGFPSLGCWSDAVSTRALSVWGVVEGGLTVAKCAAACASQGFGLSGVEYGQGMRVASFELVVLVLIFAKNVGATMNWILLPSLPLVMAMRVAAICPALVPLPSFVVAGIV